MPSSRPEVGVLTIQTRTSHICYTPTTTPAETPHWVRYSGGMAHAGSHLDFSHVYVFDRVFSPTTMASLARVLQRSPFRVLVSYRTASEWWEHGLSVVQPVAKLRLSSTGKEGMTCWIYINMRYAPR